MEGYLTRPSPDYCALQVLFWGKPRRPMRSSTEFCAPPSSLYSWCGRFQYCLREALRDWLTGQGLLKHRDDPEGAKGR
jgi:hypothetical protein